MRIIITHTEKWARITIVGQAIHKRLISDSKEGLALIKFIYGQLFNGKLAQRYGYAPTNEC